MKHLFKYILLLPICLSLAACATQPRRQPLSLQSRKMIKSDKVVLNSTQKKIGMEKNDLFSSDIPDPYAPMDSGAIVRRHDGAVVAAAAAGGLIGVLVVTAVEASNSPKAGASPRRMIPLQKALGKFDYLHYFKEALKQKLATLPWLKIQKEVLRYNIRSNEQTLTGAAKQNTTLFIGATYLLNSTLQQLEVIAYVKLDKKQPKGWPVKTLYKNNFYYIYRLSNKNNMAANKRIWTENHAAFLKAKLRDASGLLSKMIVMDIKKPKRNPYANIKKTVSIRTLKGIIAQGKVISHKNGYYILSLVTHGFMMDGFMYAVNANAILHGQRL